MSRRSSTPTRRVLAALSAAAAVALTPATLFAQARPKYDKGDEPPGQFVMFSISGGISLGSYQAGVNWGLLELYRAARSTPAFADSARIPRVDLGSLAGASAGNINTLLWAVEVCTRRRQHPPDASLFWQTWVPVGLPQLLPRNLQSASSERALFDRGFLKQMLDTVKARFRSPDLQPGCSVPIGITLTRILPDYYGMEVPTQRFTTAFYASVRPDTGGRPEMVFTWPALKAPVDRFGKLALPPRGRNNLIDPDTIFQIVQASSAFPIAFQPKLLNLFHVGRNPTDLEERSDWYVDGGVFDNNPVGLAIAVARTASATIFDDDRSDLLNVIYVNPGRLREPLKSLRRRKEMEVASGGIKAAAQLLSGAVPTARQYELQMVVRDREVIGNNELVVLSTTRTHPVVGEHLHAFGAFLARPFREYDFYVGVYDALHFAAHDYTCSRSRDRDCVPKSVAKLLGGGQVNFGPLGPPLLAELFAKEFADSSYRALVQSVRSRVVRDTSAANRAGIDVLLALHRAQETQWTKEAPSCGDAPLPGLLLCASRLLHLVQELGRDKGALAAVKDWKRACESKPSDRRSTCQEAQELAALVEHPERYASEAVDRALQRMLEVEHQVHLDFERRPIATGAKKGERERVDMERPVGVVVAVYRANSMRPRYGWEWSPTSALGRGRFWRYAMPYHVTADLAGRGFDVGYRPTAHLSRKFAAIFPLSGYGSQLSSTAADGRIEERRVWYAGPGAGLAYKALPRPFGFLIPEVGASAQLLRRIGDGRSGDDPWVVVGDLYGDFPLLAGRLHIALRYANDEAPLFNHGGFQLAAGIADLYGIGYWLDRLRK